MLDGLQNLYDQCLSVSFKPHNYNVKETEATLYCETSIKHPIDGTFTYAKFYISKPTLDKAIKSANHIIKNLKEAIATS